MLAQRSNELDPVNHGDLITSMGQLQRNARDLQESVMSIRMMPMEYVSVQSFPSFGARSGR